MSRSRLSVLIASLTTVTLVAGAVPATAQSSFSSSSLSSFFSSSDNNSSPEVPEEPNGSVATPMTSEVLFSEGFDGTRNPAKFTHEAPAGWSTHTSGVTSGEERWNGWAFSTIRDWTWASGTDMRHWFTQGH